VTRSFVLVTAAASCYFTAIGMMVPTLPRMVRDDLGGGGLAVGVAGGAIAITAALLRPWVGRVGDRSGRRLLVVGGASIAAVAYVGHAAAAGMPGLIGARLLLGCGEAMFFVGAATAIQDIAPDERRGEAASYFSVAIWGGLGIGPALGEWIRGEWSTDAVWIAAAALCALAAVIGLATPVGTVSEPGTGPKKLLHPAALGPGIVLMLAVIGLSAFQTFVALYVEDLGLSGAAAVFGVYSALVLGVRIFGAGLADRYRPRRVAMAGIALAAVGLGAIAAVPTIAGLYLGAALLAIGFGPVYPALLTLVVDVAPEAERTSAVATFTLFFDLAQGAGLPVLGLVVSLGGERSAFAAGSAILAITVVTIVQGLIRDPTPEPTAPGGH
jgi:MFS family permease